MAMMAFGISMAESCRKGYFNYTKEKKKTNKNPTSGQAKEKGLREGTDPTSMDFFLCTLFGIRESLD